MGRRVVAAFLDRVAEDEELQQDLVELAAEHGFEFTEEELCDAEPGVTAEPRTWKRLAGFPDLDDLPSRPDPLIIKTPGRVFWLGKISLLTATNLVLFGSLAWYLWSGRRRH
jgi:hypothetical protein